MYKLVYLLSIYLSVNLVYANEVIIQSTTSTRDSGLYSFLLPKYPEFSTTNIKVIAVGTGQAILNAKNCDGDILIVHDKSREEEFMQNGFGTIRHNLMYNDFVIVGPKDDPANIKSSQFAHKAFKQIFKSKSKFISRSDSSGTHSFELSLWNKANIDAGYYSGRWYLETGQGMGPTLNITVAMNGYTISDRSTWLKYNNKRSHVILYENPQELRNEYGMILVNSEKCQDMNIDSAIKLYKWMSSEDAKSLINMYRIKNSQVFYTY